MRSGPVHAKELDDPTLVSVVARAYATSPWVRRVVHVRKQYPNQVKVTVDLGLSTAIYDKFDIIIDRQ